MTTPKTISRRDAWKRIGLACAGTWAGAVSASARDEPKQRPNIVFIFTDDHASHAISAYGSKINQTPNMDRLAREGMLFSNAFCGNSICAPSRATLLTGQHSHINGKKTNSDHLNPGYVNFPSILQQQGYQTALFGKWHIPEQPQGFDQWQILSGQGHYYNPEFRLKNGEKKRIEGYATDIVTDLSLDWLQNQRKKNQPFLLMVQHKAPHRTWMPGPDHLTMYDDVDIPEPATLFDDYQTRNSNAPKHAMGIKDHLRMAYDLQNPIDPNEPLYQVYQRFMNRMTKEQKEKWDAAFEPKNKAFREQHLTGDDLVRWKYQRYIKNYLRCIASVDDNIGRLLAYLDQNGLSENTVVVYTSDQGFYLGDHGWFDKRWMYEESLRIPLIVRWPKAIQAGVRSQALVQNIDFAPTFIDIAGGAIPAVMQGRSLKPLFQGKTPADWRDSIYYHYYECPSEHRVPCHYGIRTQRYKLIYYYNSREWELFDLQSDPHELNNLAASPSHRDLFRRLKNQLKDVRRYYQDTTGKEFE